MRIGETCGRRWRDWVPNVEALGSLRVHTQYNDQPLKTAKSGDAKERMVPVHPELEKVLWCWQGQGFEAVYGRPPGLDDFIVPDPRTMAARTQSQATKSHKRDAELIGIPNKGSHALRRFMISAARSSGARRDVLEQITHNARGAIIDVYTSWEWPALCEAVSCLKDDPDRLPGWVYDILMTYALPKTLTRGNHFACLVEAVGIEQPGVRPIPTILQRFRGQVSTKTRPKNTNKTRCRTFL